MAEAVIVLDPAFVVGKTDPRLFGSFVEHLGRCVYGGIFEPGHPTADGEGFRHGHHGAETTTDPPHAAGVALGEPVDRDRHRMGEGGRTVQDDVG